MPGLWHSQPSPTSLGQGCMHVQVPPALLADWLGSFTCHCSNTGVEKTLNKSQHTKLTLEKWILLPLLPGLKLATSWSQVWQSYHWAMLALKKWQFWGSHDIYITLSTICWPAATCSLFQPLPFFPSWDTSMHLFCWTSVRLQCMMGQLERLRPKEKSFL